VRPLLAQSEHFRMTALVGTFRTLRDVRLESGMRTKADVRARLPDLWVHAMGHVRLTRQRMPQQRADDKRNPDSRRQ